MTSFQISDVILLTYFSSSFIRNCLGFAHSAVSPILHWVLNYNSLRQSACQPFAKLNSAQRFLRSHLRFTGPPPAPASSTNEAALGPFNPRFIKQRPQVHKPPASSHYLYWASAIHIKVKYIFNNREKGKKPWTRRRWESLEIIIIYNNRSGSIERGLTTICMNGKKLFKHEKVNNKSFL